MFRGGDDGFGGYEGGGFDTSGFGTGETPQADKKGPKRTDHLVPVTVRQVLDSPDTGLKIGQSDMEAQMLKLVGIVKKINRSSVKIIYTLEDNTGSIEGIHWLEAETDENFVVPVVENTYVSMIGAVRNANAQFTQKHIMVFKIQPITDLNAVTQHVLSIIHLTLKSEDLTQQTPVPAAKQEMSTTYGGMDTSMGGGSDYAAGFNLNPQQQRVLKAVAQNCQSELGASVETIVSSLTVKMPMKEVEKILEFLASEGHVYSTSDERHYKATDSFN
ncbi:replication protein A 32 kDa subunit-B isoform X2 [Homalodisca vitripennis]|uniref:replication protein A 32 kDa subunit-B isoform X2 n=1 Tax=Homalodisca vitripennis TaxID=197043 RepID=UPI001EEB0CDB|nr:replication protein A 32 kDa subunit-B isoform X2 [Homalodisca vitripennis]